MSEKELCMLTILVRLELNVASGTKWRKLVGIFADHPFLKVESTRAGCSGLCPVGFLLYPRTEIS